jgi:two-component system response regulator NreC
LKGGTAIRVLLADDHAVLRAGVRLLVDAQPDLTVVAEAADGESAIEKARETSPDVVVLDLTMPHTEPLATIRELVQLGTRVVVLTMHDDSAYTESALAAGALGYVVKRAADVELLAAIRAVQRGRRFVVAGSLRAGRLARGGGAFRPLSAREKQVVGLIGHGFTNREIAERLEVGLKSVETFRARACDKLGLRSRADLVRHALQMGLVDATDG